MKSLMLLPKTFKSKGLILFTIGLTGMFITAQNGLINFYRLILPGGANLDGSYPYPPDFWQYNQLLGYCSIALAIIGLLCFFFSKEKDEFLYSIKLESIRFAVTIQLFMSIIIGIYYILSPNQTMMNALTGLLVMLPISFWLAYIVRYYYIVYVKSNVNSGT